MPIIPPCRPSGATRGEYQNANAKIRPAYRKDTKRLVNTEAEINAAMEEIRKAKAPLTT